MAGPSQVSRPNRRAVLAAATAIALACLFACAGCSGAGNDRNVTGRRPQKAGSEKPCIPAHPEPGAEAGQPAGEPRKPFVRQHFRENRTIHFAWSDPPNNALLPRTPEMVTVSFNSDLGSGSFIRVTVDGKEVSRGSMILHPDNRTVSVRLNPYAGTGNYSVEYAAYWSDGSYCEGSFGFSVLEP